jgi:hypothetical protein
VAGKQGGGGSSLMSTPEVGGAAATLHAGCRATRARGWSVRQVAVLISSGFRAGLGRADGPPRRPIFGPGGRQGKRPLPARGRRDTVLTIVERVLVNLVPPKRPFSWKRLIALEPTMAVVAPAP